MKKVMISYAKATWTPKCELCFLCYCERLKQMTLVLSDTSKMNSQQKKKQRNIIHRNENIKNFLRSQQLIMSTEIGFVRSFFEITLLFFMAYKLMCGKKENWDSHVQ